MELMSNPILAFGWMDFLRGLLIAVFLLTCLLLIAVILLQKGRGGGISSAFGGGMSSSPFGTKTGDVFTWITVVLAGIFLITVLFLNTMVVEQKPQSTYKEEQPAPAAAGETPTETRTASTDERGGVTATVEIPPTSQPAATQDSR